MIHNYNSFSKIESANLQNQSKKKNLPHVIKEFSDCEDLSQELKKEIIVNNFECSNSEFLNQKELTDYPKIKNPEKKPLEVALYVVATPIGNLRDITLRALDVLREVDVLICEDSRVSMRLLQAYKIESKKLIICNDHSENKIREKILNFLLCGKSIGLISDAGTPLISDPGYKLISFLRDQNQKIIPIPGPSSLLSCLCASGLACDNFLFLGFLPTSKTQKSKLLSSLSKSVTFVFFESANRILKSLEAIQHVLGNRKVCIARELTKIHEEITTLEVEDALKFFNSNPEKLRGEMVVVVEKIDKNEKDFSDNELLDDINYALSKGKSIKDLSQDLAEIYGINKKEIYRLALEISREN